MKGRRKLGKKEEELPVEAMLGDTEGMTGKVQIGIYNLISYKICRNLSEQSMPD